MRSVVDKATGDYFSGLNFGFIGSGEANPNDPEQTIGNSPSWTWYGNQPDGGGPKPLPLATPTLRRSRTRTSLSTMNMPSYLNNSTDPVTNSYGFPFTDRLTSPLAALNSNTTLTLTVLADGSGLNEGAPVPEPSTWALLAAGVLGLAGYRRALAGRAAPR